MKEEVHLVSIEFINEIIRMLGMSYSDFFRKLYNLEKISHKMTNLLLWSVRENLYLPPRDDVLKHNETLWKEEEKIARLWKRLRD